MKQDQQVDVGDKLLVFDREAIQSAGYDITVMMIITNAENYNIRETEDTATNGNWLLAVAPQ